MKYMLLLNRTSDALPEPGTAELNRIIQEYGAAMEAMARAGVLIDCAALGGSLLDDDGPGPGRRDDHHRRAVGGDQGAARRVQHHRVRRSRRGAQVGG